MFNKAQLIDRAKHYFNDKDRKVIYGTTDGHFFNEQHFASSHVHGKELEVIQITRADLDKKVEKKEVKKESKETTEKTETNKENRYEEYEKETGKKAVWHDKETRAYTKWLEDN